MIPAVYNGGLRIPPFQETYRDNFLDRFGRLLTFAVVNILGPGNVKPWTTQYQLAPARKNYPSSTR